MVGSLASLSTMINKINHNNIYIVILFQKNMATIDEVHRKNQEAEEERKRALKENPLLEKGLGQLIHEANKLSLADPWIVEMMAYPKEVKTKIPLQKSIIYGQYKQIIDEIDRREKEYQTKECLLEQRF